MTRPSQATGAVDGTTSTDTGNDWRAHAACLNADPETFFPIGTTSPLVKAQVNEAKAICWGCPVIETCLHWALTNREEHGVWGGLTEEERRRIRRRATQGQGRRPPNRRPPTKRGGCGTPAGRNTHHREGEHACRPCADAYEADQRGEYEPPAKPEIRCGTEEGYDLHMRLQEGACDPCKAAHAAHSREYRAALRIRVPVDDIVTEIEFLLGQGMGPDQIADAVHRKRSSLVGALRSRGRDDLAARFLRREQAA